MFKPAKSNPSAYSGDVKLHKRSGDGTPASGRYPYRLNFYDRPPSLDITLDEFETCALARLRVLSHIETLSHRNLPPAQMASAIATYTKQHLPLHSNTAHTANLEEERRHDEIGHWVLRLAFSRSPELRARFIRAETALFRHRFETDDAGERAAFLNALKLDWTPVRSDEKKRLEKQLHACVPWLKEDQFNAESWYKVSWIAVPDLVAQRKVYIQGGFAYVPQSQQISLVLQTFGARLEKALEITAKNLPRLDEDERLGPVIDHLASSFLAGIAGGEYTPSDSGAAVTAEMVDEMARKHFPPCMLNLYLNLKQNHHLKHFGRLQLSLFLKGLGLPLEEALIFWRRQFSTMSDDKFNKEYRYNLRHNYGQEGKRANYAPKSCQQILTANQPGTQDNHGCPFRHFSPDNLSTFLVTNYPQLDRGSLEYREIMDSVKNHHYHVACTRLFEVTHNVKKGEGIGNDESVSHPNKWADRSRELERERLAAVNGEDVTMA